MSEQATNDLFLDEAIRAGVIAPSQVQEVLDEHERTGKPTRTVAVELGALTEDQAVQVIGDFLAAERVDLDHMTISHKNKTAEQIGGLLPCKTTITVEVCMKA